MDVAIRLETAQMVTAIKRLRVMQRSKRGRAAVEAYISLVEGGVADICHILMRGGDIVVTPSEDLQALLDGEAVRG